MQVYPVDMSETGGLLRHGVVLPVELCTSNTVRHQRNVDALDAVRIAAGFDDEDGFLLFRQSVCQHGTRRPTANCRSISNTTAAPAALR